MKRSEKIGTRTKCFEIIGTRMKCFEIIGTENNSVFQYVEKNIETKSSYVAIFGIAANRHLKKTLRLFEVPVSISK